MQFTIETEIENRLNFLDITIHRMQRNLQFGIYRKPTATDIMIHNQSCHPSEQKWSGIAYLINIGNKLEEKNIIEHLLIANAFHQNVTDILNRQKQVKIEEEPMQEPQKKKWVTFTYMGKETRYITKLFKKFNMNIALRTTNTLEQHLSLTKHKTDIYDRCGLYKI
jgi:hypothetical protein